MHFLTISQRDLSTHKIYTSDFNKQHTLSLIFHLTALVSFLFGTWEFSLYNKKNVSDCLGRDGGQVLSAVS